MTICVTRSNRYVSTKLYKKSYALSKVVLDSYVKATGCKKEYIWETDSMTGNNWSKVPTTLIEMGYMSNPSEDRKMQTKAYQKKMVKGMADGIQAYFLGRGWNRCYGNGAGDFSAAQMILTYDKETDTFNVSADGTESFTMRRF